MFSRACKYAIKIMIFIATNSKNNARIPHGTIAKAMDLPKAYSAKILQQLVKDSLLNSSKGPNGGFSLPTKRSDISIRDIVVAIDGPSLFDHCLLGLEQCSSANRCAVHHNYKDVRVHLTDMLQYTNLQDVQVSPQGHSSIDISITHQ